MDTMKDAKIIIKGYGYITANVIMYLIDQEKIDPSQITVFDDRSEVGGCWLEANSYTEAVFPIIGNREGYYPVSQRMLRHLQGTPINKASILHNMKSIYDALKFRLVLNSKIIHVDEKAKKVQVQHKDGRVEEHAYDILFSPQYRSMNTFKRTLSLSDGMLSVDLAKYDTFTLVGNSVNTGETIRYIIDNIDPKKDFKIKVYYRHLHYFIPQAIFMPQKYGLPFYYLQELTDFITDKFFAQIASCNMELVSYAQKAVEEAVKKGYWGLHCMCVDLLFHPCIAKRLEFIHYSGDIKDITVSPNELLIDTRNEITSPDPKHFPSDHLKLDMGHIIHPTLMTFNAYNHATIIPGLNSSVWSAMCGKKPDDTYFRKAEKAVMGGMVGTSFWNYAHDYQAKLVPFAYFLFPIDTKCKYYIWRVYFALLRYTGLIAFFINLEALEQDEHLIDETEAGYFLLKKEWEDLDQRFNGGVPYPVAYGELIQKLAKIKCSIVDCKRHLGFYKKIRYCYYAAALAAVLTLLSNIL